MNTNRRQFITTLGLSAIAVSAGVPAWAMGQKTDWLEKIGFISVLVVFFYPYLNRGITIHKKSPLIVSYDTIRNQLQKFISEA